MKIKKCKQCGKTDFIIQEIFLHIAVLSPRNSRLTVCKERGGGIDRILCKNCEQEYSENDFALIDF